MIGTPILCENLPYMAGAGSIYGKEERKLELAGSSESE
jgi:hypothetical protein